ncbi:hypothetical protein GGTG_01295 [Gaeumannomyces tritici R3-111a-1]|uniref:Uncharacterized protein n=1 Tax=Gaeumannomyces tritici (strain R3-111a-1) TaxID=644352 RepID=J3NJ62_GAET3|nr:hypothetical protein GGTG_01295 [Gaeumannomyces tritici R3-111a-1]EJT81312.1 hypothetical protein GGTG_01295 [Gaeumannomyces tritici R3-111a-1]
MSGHPSHPDPNKGKEKATSGNSERGETNEDGSGTGAETTNVDFSSRLANSAAHLTRSLLSHRPEASDLARLSSVGGTKAEAVGSQQFLNNGEGSSASAQPRWATASSSGAFRSTEADVHAAQSEAEFSAFLDGTSVSLPSGQSELDAAWARAHGGDGEPQGGTCTVAANSIADQEARDGTEVIDLLTRPETEPDLVMEENMSATEAAALRSALFDSGPGARVSSVEWDNILNFIPDFTRPDAGAVPGGANAIKSAESQRALGLPHGPEGEKVWLDQWMGVLTAYNEEVWGDLGILVQQAKEEVQQLEDLKPGEAPPTTKAVLRLQQILGHIRGF